MRNFAIIALLGVVSFCGTPCCAESSSGALVWTPPDLSFLDTPFNACKVESSALVTLSPADKCMVNKLSARCSKADDCLVKCLVTKGTSEVGGGCWHICFDFKFDLSKWTPPKGADGCSKLSREKAS